MVLEGNGEDKMVRKKLMKKLLNVDAVLRGDIGERSSLDGF